MFSVRLSAFVSALEYVYSLALYKVNKIYYIILYYIILYYIILYYIM